MKNEKLIEVKNLSKIYILRKGLLSILSGKGAILRAVDRISFDIMKGEVFGLVGESGSGKTTTGKILAMLEPPTEGKVLMEGVNIGSLKGKELKRFRRKVQMIFQDPYESLDPRYTIYDTIYEPLSIHKIGSSREERTELICRALEQVELKPPQEFLNRYPHELSGGQRQKVSIARAIVLNPEFIIADEPVSMIDTSDRAGILNLMRKLRREMGVTYLFITHDFAVARYMTTRIAVMYQGKIVELGPTEEIIRNSMHPYTRLLISSIPVPDPEYSRPRVRIQTETWSWSTIHGLKGCRFYPRCEHAVEKCKLEEPNLKRAESNHWIACHLYNLLS